MNLDHFLDVALAIGSADRDGLGTLRRMIDDRLSTLDAADFLQTMAQHPVGDVSAKLLRREHVT